MPIRGDLGSNVNQRGPRGQDLMSIGGDLGSDISQRGRRIRYQSDRTWYLMSIRGVPEADVTQRGPGI